MIERIIEFSARNRLLVLGFYAALVVFGFITLRKIPLDAIPDLSETQVIVYSRWDRSPDVMEDQVTYPITSALLGAPKVKAIRGFSDFGFSFVYVIFQDGTDLYWARSRVLEYLSKIQARLPEGVRTELGPDATGVGWVYQYALVDHTGASSLADLRSFQDWNLRYQLQALPGVAEVASFGGFVKQYQVAIDPSKLALRRIPLSRVTMAIRASNEEAGGRLIELGSTEFMVRGRGYLRSARDLERVVIDADSLGTPVLLRDVATISEGSEMRRGAGELNGEGEVVGGIIVMRHGENALNVISGVKTRLRELERSFPPGVQVVPTYDRSELILHSVQTLRHELIAEMIIVSLVILVFLWHIPSALVPIVTIPISVLLAFLPMSALGISSNIMSLAGIAISIGVLVDGAIVEVENAYKKLQLWQDSGGHGDFHEVRLSALKEVGPSVFFSLLVIAIAFLPIFTLVDQNGRLFRPLAYTKNFAMAIAAVLAITLDPALRMLFSRMERYSFRPRAVAWIANQALVGTYHAEERHPISRALFAAYEPLCRWVLRFPRTTILLAALAFVGTVPFYFRLGWEFMPPLNEETILYMPTTLPGISVTQAQKMLQMEDRILRTFPEVVTVHGKAGRADTSTDPAPLSMMETTVVLKPPSEWRRKERWYSARAPEWLESLVLRRIWPDRISWEELVDEMDAALRFPGNTNAWVMPIKNRIDMLATGIRTPVGVKVFGPDLHEIERVGLQIKDILESVPGTRSVYAERVTGGYFLDFDLRRQDLSRYGLAVGDVQSVIQSAIGGETITTTVEGRERYSVSLRYLRDYREDPESLRRVLISTPSGAAIPISEVADLELREGPSMYRNENGLLAGYVFVDVTRSDLGGYVHDARSAVDTALKLPPGYSIQWSGQYEIMLRGWERLKLVIPVTILLIFALLFANTRSAFKSILVLMAVPFSAIGAIWLMYALGYHLSIAAWVGMIALMGLDAETGVFMLLFLDLALDDAARRSRLETVADLKEAIVHGAVKRIRPKMMTVTAAFMGLMPIMVTTGTGADMMKRIAAPMVGGLVTSFLLELLVYPAVYLLWKQRGLRADEDTTPA